MNKLILISTATILAIMLGFAAVFTTGCEGMFYITLSWIAWACVCVTWGDYQVDKEIKSIYEDNIANDIINENKSEYDINS